MKNKTCKGCLMFLDIKHFSKSKNVKDGYENKCKHCRNKQRMKYTNICKVCESSFKTSKKQTMYCSSECQGFRSEEHTSELQSRGHLVCRLLLEKKKKNQNHTEQAIIILR